MEEIKLLVNKADNFIKAAKILLINQQYDSSASRSYYAMFSMVSAILLTQNYSFSTHSGLLSKFSELFIKTGVFPKEFGRYLSRAFDNRAKGDYDIYTNIDNDLAEDLLQTAMFFNDALKSYLQSAGFLD